MGVGTDKLPGYVQTQGVNGTGMFVCCLFVWGFVRLIIETLKASALKLDIA